MIACVRSFLTREIFVLSVLRCQRRDSELGCHVSCPLRALLEHSLVAER